ncbi:MAG: peptidase M50 [Clostridium sp.]|nr:peptidase M50 [Clostridium sp.]
MSFGKLRITASFLLLMAFLNYMDQQGIVPLSLLACAIHEAAHVAAIRCLGGSITLLRLTAFGAEIRLSRSLSYGRELLAAAAGPGINLLMCGLCCLLPGWDVFAGLNLVLAAFNLLPLERLDGGRITACALSLTAGPEAAHWTMLWLGRILSGTVLGLGLGLVSIGGSPTLLLAALWLAAQQWGSEG